MRPSNDKSYDNLPDVQGKTRFLDLDYRLAATLAYVPLFPANVVLALLWVVSEQNSKALRYNSLQSLALSAVFLVLSFGIGLLSLVFMFLPFLLPLLHATSIICFIAYVAFSAIAMKQAHQGKVYKIPFVSDLVDQYISNKES
jgi:uncharacterized membrane protein